LEFVDQAGNPGFGFVMNIITKNILKKRAVISEIYLLLNVQVIQKEAVQIVPLGS
jgi:hypothetical protein